MNDKNSALASTEQVSIFDTTKNTNLFSVGIENKSTLINRSSYSPEEISAPKASNDKATRVANSNESYNATTQAMAPTRSKAIASALAIQPDLIVQSTVSAPSSAAVGSTIQLSYQIENQGNASAGYSYTKFYLSKDLNIGTEDIFLGYDDVTSIPSGYYTSESTTLTIPNSVAAGSYYLAYQADGYENVVESNESNNAVAGTINITKADLIIQNAIAPTSASVGSTIQLDYQVKNQGAGSAVASHTNFYLSKDKILSSDDTYLSYSRSYFSSGLSSGYYESESDSFVLSSKITFGNYYLLFQADGNGEIFETKENNNVTAKAITIAAPDLVIQNAIAPTKANIGTSIKVSYQVKNQGNGKTSLNSTYFYLSKDPSFSNDDVYLGYDYINNYNDLAPSAVSSESTSLSLPSKTTPGNYYLLYKADGDASLKESNENNNVVAKAIKITAPDLVIADASAPTSAAIGTKFEFTYEVKNQGNGNAGSNKGAFYLSRDTNLGGDDDISIGYDSVPINSLAVSAVVSRSVSWTIDTTIAAGKYYLMFKADGGGNIAESNESNNAVYIPFTLTPANGGGFNSTTGYGLVNAAAAVVKALGQTTFADVPNLGGDNWGADAIKAPEVWAKGYTGKGIVVAVLDTGVDRNHPDLSANIWKNTKEIAGNGKDDDSNGFIDDVYGWNFINKTNNTFDANGHGTHVAGTIAAVKNNFGVTGIAYNAKIMPVQVLDDEEGSSSGNSVNDGIYYAVNNGANVINLSLGGPSGDSERQKAIQYAVSKGVIVVMAAGNDSKSEPDYPARYATKWGLAVGAVYYDRTLTDFSHRAGKTPLAYVTAPGAYESYFGIGIYSTYPGNKYESLPGTSMAAPHVAGVVALMLSAKKGLTDAQVRNIVTTTAGNSLA
ncbi:CARDB domain-containing protein [Nostoc sp.]|uniref:CARDB domain-containing protein n=1 Tax=Nostoc sp. TaxID=1180 RepID=UPI003593ACBF